MTITPAMWQRMPWHPRAQAVAALDREYRALTRSLGVLRQRAAGTDATASRVGELAGRVDLLHLAAHGHHVADNPLFSTLELVDGPWFGYDLDQLPQVPETVILSACEVGATTIRRGEVPAAGQRVPIDDILVPALRPAARQAHDLVRKEAASGRNMDFAEAELRETVPVEARR